MLINSNRIGFFILFKGEIPTNAQYPHHVHDTIGNMEFTGEARLEYIIVVCHKVNIVIEFQFVQHGAERGILEAD